MKRAGDVFSALFNNPLFDGSQMQKADAFFSCWTDLVEKNGIAAAAAHSRIKTLDRGLVLIEVDHPGWKQILQTKESKLLSDFHYRFPDMDISGIAIILSRPGDKLASVTSTAAVQEENPLQKQAAPTAVADNLDTEYEAIKDPALREVLMRLEQNIIERESNNNN